MTRNVIDFHEHFPVMRVVGFSDLRAKAKNTFLAEFQG